LKRKPREIAAKNPTHLIISPGPCTPREAGVSCECAKRFAGKLPLLGVCLGHQSISNAFGAEIVRAKRLMHGKTDMIHHDGSALFADMDNPFQATRYHSLIVQPETLSEEFEVCAWAEAPDGEREIMGVRRREQNVWGVQFHPESFLTLQGPQLLRNFLRMRT
ncbi:MAG: aminodeoxychorismate/anthranilate synthase component II, partial [Planctomycetales bacterium]